jgi:hypothetical protein
MTLSPRLADLIMWIVKKKMGRDEIESTEPSEGVATSARKEPPRRATSPQETQATR